MGPILVPLGRRHYLIPISRSGYRRRDTLICMVLEAQLLKRLIFAYWAIELETWGLRPR